MIALQFWSPEVKQHAVLTTIYVLLTDGQLSAGILEAIQFVILDILFHTYLAFETMLRIIFESADTILYGCSQLHILIRICCMHNKPYGFLIAEEFYLQISFWREYKLGGHYQTQYHECKDYPVYLPLFCIKYQKCLKLNNNRPLRKNTYQKALRSYMNLKDSNETCNFTYKFLYFTQNSSTSTSSPFSIYKKRIVET